MYSSELCEKEKQLLDRLKHAVVMKKRFEDMAKESGCSVDELRCLVGSIGSYAHAVREIKRLKSEIDSVQLRIHNAMVCNSF